MDEANVIFFPVFSETKPHLVIASEAWQSRQHALALMHSEEIATSLPALRQVGSSQ